MKTFIAVVLAVAGLAASAEVEIVRYDNDLQPDGSYSFDVETNNGISARAQGVLRDFGGNPPLSAIVAQGGFGWTSPEGKKVQIDYIADENGYQPTGDVIPTPPAIPEEIARALAYIAKKSAEKK